MLDFEQIYNQIIISEGYKEVRTRITPLLKSITPEDIKITLEKHKNKKDKLPEEYKNIDIYFSKKYDNDIINRYNNLQNELSKITDNIITKKEIKKNLYENLKLIENDEYILFYVPTHEDAIKLVKPGNAAPADCDWPSILPVTWCIAADSKQGRDMWKQYHEYNIRTISRFDNVGVYYKFVSGANFYFAFRKHPLLNQEIKSNDVPTGISKIYQVNSMDFIAIRLIKNNFEFTRSPNQFPASKGWPYTVPKEWEQNCISVPKEKIERFIPYNKLNSIEWVELLSRYPECAKYCDSWDKISSKHWSELLSKQPSFAQYCDKWNELSEIDWYIILKEQPQFADKCDKWDEFDKDKWLELLKIQPQLSIYCNIWDEFNYWDWISLLKFSPQLADKCDKWDEFGSIGWVKLLIYQPQFADKCNAWRFFDEGDWDELLRKQPQFKNIAKYYYNL